MINGTNCLNKRVQDLFCSVQLNVNNPHFLIMQGRITKVLNMKPPEILSMIEEAAGTSMYEVKRMSTRSTIERKDIKMKELSSVVKEEIAPKLEKMKTERQQVMEYNKIQRELDLLTRLYVAWRYVSAEEKGGVLETLEKQLKEKEKLEAKALANQKNIKDTLASEEKNKKQLAKSLKEDKALPQILFILCNRENDATGTSPSELLVGRNLPRPGDWIAPG
uniref:Uncharacterized protein n=1 Tax=Timema bartmani TaxID=61472 RepID=A0A7R9I1V8_9NEOP|nr:unnamed protein product [Timema bartmani]